LAKIILKQDVKPKSMLVVDDEKGELVVKVK